MPRTRPDEPDRWEASCCRPGTEGLCHFGRVLEARRKRADGRAARA